MEENEQITETNTNRSNPMIIGGVILTLLILGAVVAIFTTSKDNSAQQEKVLAENTQTHATEPGETNLVVGVDELAKHNSRTDCYVAFSGKVYNLTPFISQHPGGDKILQKCGAEVDDFSSMHPGGEFGSPKVQASISSLVVGEFKK